MWDLATIKRLNKEPRACKSIYSTRYKVRKDNDNAKEAVKIVETRCAGTRRRRVRR
jgi:hypothetical protein